MVFAGDISWINLRADEIRTLKKRKVAYRIIWFKQSKEVAPNVRKALKAGAELRCVDDPSNNLRGIISDNNKVFLIQRLPKPGMQPLIIKDHPMSDEFANYSGTLVSSNMIAKVFREYFYCLWQKGMTAEEFLKKFG